jgi:hypothetical protein
MVNQGLLVALSSALAFGAGLGLGLTFHGTAGNAPTLDEPLSMNSAHADELTLLLKDVHRAIELLTAEVQRHAGEPLTPVSDSSQRRLPDAAAPAPDSTELAGALKSLADALRELRTSEGAAMGKRTEELVKPPFVDREAAFAATGMERASAAGEAALASADAAFNHSHMFMTSQAVLSRYGTPDHISFEDSGEVWVYELPREGGSVYFTIRFHQGTVFECEFSG